MARLLAEDSENKPNAERESPLLWIYPSASTLKETSFSKEISRNLHYWTTVSNVT